MDSRDKSRRLFSFLEWDFDKDKKFEISGPNGLWSQIQMIIFSLEWDIDAVAKSESSGPNGRQ